MAFILLPARHGAIIHFHLSSIKNYPLNSPAIRAAIVTGAGTGIGAAIARRLAADGYATLLCYNRSAEGVQRTLEAITEAGGQARLARADIADASQVEALFANCRENYAEPEVVINNAGIGHMAAFAEISDADYDRLFDTNVRGTFHMCREAARHIQDNGVIINISSGVGVSSAWGMGLYTACKLAIEGFTKALAHELGPRGIRVNTVSPGMTDTPMLEGGDADALREYGAERSVMKRVGQPEDVADVVASLVGSDGRWITGQNIHADGGSIIL